MATLANLLNFPGWQLIFFYEDDYGVNIITADLIGLGRCGREERKRKRSRKKMSLTPDSECDVPFEISVWEGGYVAGVDSLIRLICVGDEQSWVVCGAAALELHPSWVTPKLWYSKQSHQSTDHSSIKTLCLVRQKHLTPRQENKQLDICKINLYLSSDVTTPPYTPIIHMITFQITLSVTHLTSAVTNLN